VYRATAASVRERLMERWDETFAHFTAENPKMIYYLSMEFLQARAQKPQLLTARP
jgi:starch phosphorylase